MTARLLHKQSTNRIRNQPKLSSVTIGNRRAPKSIVVKLVNDRLEADNQRFQVVTVRDAIPVLIVEGHPAGSLREQSSHYLRTALENCDAPPHRMNRCLTSP